MCRSSLLSVLAAAGILVAIGPRAGGQAKDNPPAQVQSASAGKINLQRLTSLEFPWGLAWLPDKRLLITEKPGRLRIWSNGKLSEPIEGVPKVVFRGTPNEQGGLLDVEADPKFAENHYVYLSYSEAAEQQPSNIAETDDYRFPQLDLSDNIVRGGAVARGRLEENRLTDVKVVWRQEPKTVGRGHFGNRLIFSTDGKLFITSGDRMRFEPAQSLKSNLGKVVRIHPDGSIPDDNPFAGKEDARGDIWSYGHRNIIAAAIDPSSARLWIFEMGPAGGDEVNLVQRGRNYGWPLVSNGDHYRRPSLPTDLSSIPGHRTVDEYEGPVRTWTPVVSPSGAIFYTGEMFRGWRGSVLVGGLSSQALVRLVLEPDRVPLEERIDMKRRIRDIIEAPDGAILVIVDGKQGDLLRLTPAQEE